MRHVTSSRDYQCNLHVWRGAYKNTTEKNLDGDDISGLLKHKIEYKESSSGKDNKFNSESYEESDINIDDKSPFKCPNLKNRRVRPNLMGNG